MDDNYINKITPKETNCNSEIDNGAFNDFNTDDSDTDNYFDPNNVQAGNNDFNYSNNPSPRRTPVKKRSTFLSTLGEILGTVVQVAGEIAQGYVQVNYQYPYTLANNYANYNRITSYSTNCPPGYYWTRGGCRSYNQYNHAIPANYAINNYSSCSNQNVPRHNCPPNYYWNGAYCKHLDLAYSH